MIQARDFIDAAAAYGYAHYAGVPCSFLTPFINTVIDDDRLTYISAANEGDAVWTRLMAHPRVQVSPHVAGWTEESYVKLSSVLADKVLAEFGG